MPPSRYMERKMDQNPACARVGSVCITDFTVSAGKNAVQYAMPLTPPANLTPGEIED